MAVQSSFGRDGAMFESLLGFVAELSVVLWSLVVLTAVIRFVGIRIYRRAGARKAVLDAEAARRAALLAAVAASVQVPLGAPPNRRAEPLSVEPRSVEPLSAAHVPAHVPALTPDSVEA